MCDVILNCTHNMLATCSAALYHIHSKLIDITADGVSYILSIDIDICGVSVVCVDVELYG